MTPFRRNAIVDQERHAPQWLIEALAEANRQWREATWWKRAYWNVRGWFQSKRRMSRQWNNLRKRGYKL